MKPKKRKEVGVVLKLDFEKAYDKVSWRFLMECLSMRGFHGKSRSWIHQILAGGTLYVKVNDQLGPYFVSHKGVRQGDPLSPLFNFVIDSLIKMVKMAQSNGLITSLVGNLIPHGVAILQYADDTIIYLKNDMEEVRNKKMLLYIYEQVAALKINFTKSEIFLINGDDMLEIQYDKLFNCQTGGFPIRYLGWQ
jgi:mannosylglycoprotein endo-beta-mannosidase